jgi:hypothetical protein
LHALSDCGDTWHSKFSVLASGMRLVCYELIRPDPSWFPEFANSDGNYVLLTVIVSVVSESYHVILTRDRNYSDYHEIKLLQISHKGSSLDHWSSM